MDVEEIIQLLKKTYMGEPIPESEGRQNNKSYKEIDIIEIIDKYEKGMLLSEIASIYGFPSKDILKKIIKNYYIINKDIKENVFYKEIAYHDRDEIFLLHLNGNSIKKIADIYNCSIYIIEQAIKRYIDENNIKQEKANKTICLEDIKEQLKNGATLYAISKRIHISQYLLANLIKSTKDR